MSSTEILCELSWAWAWVGMSKPRQVRARRPGALAVQEVRDEADRRVVHPQVRGWRHTVDIVLFEISNSMKPYPLCFTHIPVN